MPEPEAVVWIHRSVEVRSSDVAGRGLFARERLTAGTVVLRVAEDLDDEARVDLWGSRFPNHCCDPTLGWTGDRELATMTDVPADAELFTDYAMWVAEDGWLLRCHCPSYRCRQMVEGGDWRIPQLQRRYAGWWAPRVQRLLDGR